MPPSKGRIFQLIEKYKVSILYTAPTLIRTWMKWGDEYPNGSNLSSLRLLGSVGEPINPEAWMWYREVIGDKYIAGSQFYTYTDSHLPKVVTELKTYGDKLFKQIN